ncbi:MAG: PQQ-dependent sugar dehydrogenase, partial [Pseudomonadales bacterium]
MKKLLLVLIVLVTLGFLAFMLMPDLKEISQRPLVDGFEETYTNNCAACHGSDLEGSGLGPSLLADLKYGDSLNEIKASITSGFPQRGMPAWSETLSEQTIHQMGLYIAERRDGNTMADFKVNRPMNIPKGKVESELHSFTVEVVAEGIDGLPYAIARLPNGEILVTEKGLGLSIIEANGKIKTIFGTPKVYNDIEKAWGQPMGLGWMLDVALHPNYAENRWIYLSYSERCEDCNDASRGFDPYEMKMGRKVSMTKLVRGRIKNYRWVDQEVIYEPHIDTYSPSFDLSAGGRIAFDGAGHVFLSIGHKAEPDHMGIQDLTLPYGKIHRIQDNGQIPTDNPFVDKQGALPTIWTLGHRNTEGLAFDPSRKILWQSEMGPRGGDEINLLLSGENYGWPFHTSGINYDGSPVDYTDDLGEAMPIEETQTPILDITPSTAVSSIAFYTGDAFPNWQNNLLLCNLKSSDFVRLEISGNRVVHQETLLENLGRFRDVEVGQDGAVYLLVEHAAGSKILKMSA